MQTVHLAFLLLFCAALLFLFPACGPGKAENWDDDDDDEAGEAASEGDDWSYDDDAASDDDAADDDAAGDDDTADDDDADAWDVAVLDDGITGQGLVDQLVLAGIDAYLWGLESEYDGTEFNARVAVLIDGGAAVWGVDMPEAGQQGLVEFVNSGGGLMVTEWVMRDTLDHGQYQILKDILPVEIAGDGWGTSAETFTVNQSSHPIANDLPEEFSLDAISYSPLTAIRGDVVVTGLHSGDAIVADATHVGRVVYCAFAGAGDGLSGSLDIWTDPMSTLAVNIVTWLLE